MNVIEELVEQMWDLKIIWKSVLSTSLQGDLDELPVKKNKHIAFPPPVQVLLSQQELRRFRIDGLHGLWVLK